MTTLSFWSKLKGLYIPQVIPYSMEEDKVIIKVERGTREKLKARGKKGDTYEDVIQKMIADLEPCHPPQEQGA